MTYVHGFDRGRPIYERLHRAAGEAGDERAIPTMLFPWSQLEPAAGSEISASSRLEPST
jgi:hypothetical protein